jgi:hypothetical protein
MKKFRELSEKIKDKFDIGEYDQEGDMAKSDLRSILANAKRVHDMLEDDDNLPEWVQSKITKAEDYMSTVANYMEAEMNEEVELDEAIPKSTGHALVHSSNKKIIAKGNKAEMMKKMKELNAKEKGSHYLGLTNKGKVGDTFGEEVELDEENKPTNPELWSRAVSLAKSKFDVYPSAYANGWAAKWYKSKGGGWRSVSEEVVEEGSAYDRINARFKKLSGKSLEDTAKYHKAESEKLAKQIKDQEEKNRKMKTEAVKNDDLPFKADKPQKKSVVVGKKPEGYSIARQLARQAMQKQMQKMNKPVKEETNKAKIVKDMLKKKNSSEDAFQKEPELSSTLTKGF